MIGQPSFDVKIVVISIFPEMFAALNAGMPAQAQKKDLLTLHCINPRDFAKGAYKRVDDRPYGGGPGMVMMAEPLAEALQTAKLWLNEPAKVIYLSPQGAVLTQSALAQFSQQSALILIAGRYEGIDQRFIERCVDEEWSIGDYVLSGGELPAMVLIDAVSRLLPGVVNDPESILQESFSQDLLDCPHYTRPEVWQDKRVPEVLLSGDHVAIKRWRHDQGLTKTLAKRPDLLQKR